MGILKREYQNEDAAREYLERLIWPSGPVCPQCSFDKAYKLESKPDSANKVRPGLYKCARPECRKQFTVTVGTIFEDSHIPLHKWLLGIHLMCSSKKGISALQLQRELWGEDEETKRPKGSYRTAWFMAHRIRWALTQAPMTELLKGVVEVDETFMGGKQTGKGHTGRSLSGNKTPVLALVERGGNVRSFPLERATLKNIKPIMQAHIDPESHVVTDEFTVYHFIKPDFPNHHMVKHMDHQYVRYEKDLKVTTNTVESFFALLKRANYGIHHHMSRKYLGSYCAERDFVYNTRKLTDDERTARGDQSSRWQAIDAQAAKRGRIDLRF